MTKLLLLSMLTLNVLFSQGIQTSEQLVKAMHDRYTDKWYKTLTFVQKTTQYRSDTTVATWYEAFSFPGTMRIDMDSLRHSGMIISNDTLYIYRDGKLSSTRRFVHPLLLLGFDIYFLPVQETLAKLRGMYIDLSIVHEDMWQGRPVYVVGAKKDDLYSDQFWIDKERLYFVRLLGTAIGRNDTQIRETQFNKYQRMARGWISLEVIFKINGKINTTEEYSDVRTDQRLDTGLFDPQLWTTTRLR